MNDQKTVRLVILTLGVLAFAVVVGGIILALDDKGLPGELIAIGAAAAGAVGGILSKTGGTSEPQPVVGVAGGPVVTEEAPAPTRARRAAKKAAGQAGASDMAVIIAALIIVIAVVIIVRGGI